MNAAPKLSSRTVVIAFAVDICKSLAIKQTLPSFQQFTPRFRERFPHVDDKGVHMYYLAACNFTRVDFFDAKQLDIKRSLNHLG